MRSQIPTAEATGARELCNMAAELGSSGRLLMTEHLSSPFCYISKSLVITGAGKGTFLH